MYEIGKGPDTVDQRKFKAALQKEFGKWLATISKYGELYEMITGETL